MATKNEEKKDLTGLENTTVTEGSGRKDAEYNLTEALLKAADFKNDGITEIEVTRGDQYLFSFHVRPLSEEEMRIARKKNVKLHTNPNGKKLPKIEGNLDTTRFHSTIIYMATTEEDRQKIWNNQAVMQAHDVLDPIDTIDVVFMAGEKINIVNKIMEISGMDDDDDDTEVDYAKN